MTDIEELAITLKTAELSVLKKNGIIRDYTDPIIKEDGIMYFTIFPYQAVEFIEIRDFVIN